MTYLRHHSMNHHCTEIQKYFEVYIMFVDIIFINQKIMIEILDIEAIVIIMKIHPIMKYERVGNITKCL